MSIQKVTYRRLGRSGLRVSVPIFGGMSFGNPKWAPWVISKEEALPLLKAAWDRGVNTIDTSGSYSNGQSEEVIGAFMKEYKIPREEILIFTKCYFLVHKEVEVMTYLDPTLRDQPEYANQTGLSRAAIFNAVEASLQRLGTTYIDLLQIHRYDPETPIEETMKALHDLVQAGKVRYIGASSTRAWQFARMNHVAEIHGWTKFVSMQSEYSLIYREEEREMIPYCNTEGIGLIPWGPLNAGQLARPNDTKTVRSGHRGIPPEEKVQRTIVDRVEEVAKTKGWSMAQVAIAWSVSKVASPIIGISSVQRLEEAIIGDKRLTEEETRYLEELYVPRPVQNHL